MTNKPANARKWELTAWWLVYDHAWHKTPINTPRIDRLMGLVARLQAKRFIQRGIPPLWW